MSQPKEGEEASVTEYVILLLMIPTAIFVIYSSFLVFGAIAGDFVEHKQMRMILAVAFAFVFPFVTGASAFTQHSAPRFEERLRRLIAIIMVLSLGSSALVGFFLAPRAIPNLRTNANWFMSQPTGQFADLNRDYSQKLASLISKVAQ